MEMQIIIPGIAIGLIIGGLIGWLFARAKSNNILQSEKEAARQKLNELDKEFVAYKATATAQLQTAIKDITEKLKEINDLKDINKEITVERYDFSDQLSVATAGLKAANQTILDKNSDIVSLNEKLKNATEQFVTCNQKLATATANNEALNEKIETQKAEVLEKKIQYRV